MSVSSSRPFQFSLGQLLAYIIEIALNPRHAYSKILAGDLVSIYPWFECLNFNKRIKYSKISNLKDVIIRNAPIVFLFVNVGLKIFHKNDMKINYFIYIFIRLI